MRYIIPVPLGAILIGLVIASASFAQSEQNDTLSSQSSRPLIAGFVQSVTSRHPAIIAAQAEVDAASARVAGAGRALYNPELEADFEDADVTTKTVGVAQTIDWSKKRQARTDTAEADLIAAKAALELVQKSVTTDLLSALAEHQSAFEQMQLAKAQIRLAQDFLELAKTRKSAGDLSQSEYLTARLSLSQALAQQASIQVQLSQARQQLAALSGEQKDVWPLLVGVPQSGLLRAGNIQVDSLPEVRFATAKTNGFRSRIKLADRMRKADPTIGLRFGQEGDGLGGNSTLFGVRVAIPLQIFNNYSESVTAARAEAIGAEASARNVHRQIGARLQATTERYLASEKAWRLWQDAGTAQLGEQRELLNTLWEAGETDAVAYLIQLNQTFDAEAAAIELRSALWRSWFDWLDASNSSSYWLEAIQ